MADRETGMIRVLVVDDSAFMRRQISAIVEGASDMIVAGTARDGGEAVRKVSELQPDVVTLDINMPGISGLTALATIMMTRPTPCLMVSSLTQEGAQATFEALSLGAVDFVAKASGAVSLDIERHTGEIVEKVRMAARARLRPRAGGDLRRVTRLPHGPGAAKGPPADSAMTVAIGVSTGGPQTLMEILPLLPEDFPAPVLIVQHMPPLFTASLARRLDDHSALSVKEAADMEPLRPGCAYLAPGGSHLTVTQRTSDLHFCAHLSALPTGTQFCPSVDVLFDSVATICRDRAVGVLLTGMGSDGANGMVQIRGAGGITIAESEESAVVFGMPREAIARGGAAIVAPCTQIAMQIRRAVRRLA